MREEPGTEIVRFRTTQQQRVLVGGKRHRERVNIHDEDAEHGDTTQHIQTDESFGFGYGSGLRAHYYRDGVRVIALTPSCFDCRAHYHSASKLRFKALFFGKKLLGFG